VHRHYKGLFYLIEALKFKEYDIIIAGEGPVSQDIKNLVFSYNLKQIVFVGNVNEYEKEVLYKYCYAFIFPSHLRSESFGFSLLEAAMHGKSMISCEIGTGTSFININKETGLVVPPKNPKAISDAFIDNMSKCLFALIDISLTDTNVTCVQVCRFIAALSAVINQLIWIVRVNPNVIHILAYITEVHVISYILLLYIYLIFRKGKN
jgi:glycosyltransferase involved in cell wall biosynthesis